MSHRVTALIPWRPMEAAEVDEQRALVPVGRREIESIDAETRDVIEYQAACALAEYLIEIHDPAPRPLTSDSGALFPPSGGGHSGGTSQVDLAHAVSPHRRRSRSIGCLWGVLAVVVAFMVMSTAIAFWNQSLIDQQQVQAAQTIP